MGPTASGKSALAMKLAEFFSGEIISVDSAMVYRGLNIGSAKPTKNELEKIPHHLIDIRDPAERYSCANFREEALNAIELIFSKNKMPFLVGGTMLYFKALFKGLSNMPSANSTIREKLSKDAKELGLTALHDRLKEIDPIAAKKIHPHDPQRIQRALEVYELIGEPISTLHAEKNKELFPYYPVYIAIAPQDRSILHERIALRFHQMLEAGFVEEVEGLYQRGDLTKELPAIRAVGYRQVWEYLEGNLSYDEMVERGIIATRQLAKRQLTWLRHWPDIHWFDSESPELIDIVRDFLNNM